MQRYLKEVAFVTFVLLAAFTTLAAFAAWIKLAMWSPLLGIITFILIAPFIIREIEKFLEPEEIY